MAGWQADDWRGWHGWQGWWRDDAWRGWRHDDNWRGWLHDDWRGWRHDDDWHGWHGGWRDMRDGWPYVIGNWREWRRDRTENNIYEWTGWHDRGTIRHVCDGWVIPSRYERSRSPPPLLRRFILQQAEQQPGSASRVVTDESIEDDGDDVGQDYMGGGADDVNRYIRWLRSRYIELGLEHQYDSQWSARRWS